MKQSSNKLYQKYNDKILDVVLFGSSVKNKFSPNDIDIAVIIKNTKETEILDLMNKFSSLFDSDIHLNILPIETIFINPLFRTLLNEGVSLLDNKSLHEKLGYESGAIFSFNLTKLEKSKKVLFYYALYGKKKHEGLLKKLNGRLIGRSVVFIPVDFVDELKEFLERWGVDVYRIDVLKT